MARLYLPDDVARRLRDLQNEQRIKRDVASLTSKWDPKELRALSRTAHELWGDRGMAELDAEAGLVKLGVRREEGQRRPGRYSRCKWFFRGASVAEILAQVALVRARA